MSDSDSPFSDTPPKQLRPVDSRGRFRTPVEEAVAPMEVDPAVDAAAPDNFLDDGRKRIPLGQRQAKLAAPKRPGYNRRWVNDSPGRVQTAENGGYKIVLDDNKNPVKAHVGTQAVGGALYAYLMEIPQAWYDQDFAEKQKGLDEIDKAIYGGTFKEETDDKRYVPKDTPIKIGLSRGYGRG